MEYKIVYNSDVIINDPTELSTFSIFYDKIVLPYAQKDGDFTELTRKGDSYVISVTNVTTKFVNERNEDERSDEVIPKWEENNSLLFGEGVIERLDAGDQTFTFGANISDLAVTLLKNPSTGKLRFEHDSDKILIRSAIIEHLSRKDIMMPGIFTIRKNESKLEVFKALEAMHTFKYLIPALNVLHPEQILEVREKVKALREGFSMHLQKLSASVQSGLSQNAPFEDISDNARKIIETSLIPDYREFIRFIASRKTGFWARLLQTGGKVLEIDSAPWTPAFWGKLAQALGSAFSDELKDGKEEYSNVNQAYKFMHVCEQLVKPSISTHRTY